MNHKILAETSTRVRAPAAAGEFHPFVEIMTADKDDLGEHTTQMKPVPALITATPLLCGIMEYRRAGMVAARCVSFNLSSRVISSQF